MRKLESILVATDLTEASDEVLRAASALAALTSARLHVLHSFDLQSLPYSKENLARVTFPDRIESANKTLQEQVRRTVGPGVEVASQDVVIFLAHKAILEKAEAVDADLIVLGPHRRHSVGDAFLGCTADRVIRTSRVPCFVVRGPLSLPVGHVLAPVDLSQPALGALDLALEWTAAFGATAADRKPRLTVMHVIPSEYGLDGYPFDTEVIAPELERQVEAALQRANAGSVDVRQEVCYGDAPAREILEFADRERADLVVLATQGHGAVKRALIGSIASAVVRGARSHVLLVPPAVRGEVG